MCLQQLKACKVSQRATWSSSGHLPMKSHDNLTVLLEESDSCGSLLHASQARAQMGSSRLACSHLPLFLAPLNHPAPRTKACFMLPASVSPWDTFHQLTLSAVGRAKLLFVSRHHQAGRSPAAPSKPPVYLGSALATPDPSSCGLLAAQLGLHNVVLPQIPQPPGPQGAGGTAHQLPLLKPLEKSNSICPNQ